MSEDHAGSASPSAPADPHVAREDAAERTSAMVYGSILVLAALVALNPSDVSDGQAIAVVVGTGLATLFAHHYAAGQAHLVRTGVPASRDERRREWRNGLPIVTATVLPTIALLLAPLGLVSEAVAWWLAVSVIVVKISLHGYLVSRLVRLRPSVHSLVSGVGVALACAGLAVVKAMLTH